MEEDAGGSIVIGASAEAGPGARDGTKPRPRGAPTTHPLPPWQRGPDPPERGQPT